ncbi:MAG TPA: hypothetical protein VEL49_02890 [Ktedonobacteraceae bacterium]|nr:hypothetical protein [Ktedonobacteraceae bacterium]
MNQTILVALIGTTSAIVAAILTFLASAFTARQKIKEIEITYRQQSDEKYLTNARLHIDTIYLPINIGLTKLADEYREFKRRYPLVYQLKLPFHGNESSEEEIEQEWEEEKEQATEYFRDACREFLEQISDLNNQGKDAYLTKKLGERLQSFTDFLEASMDADVPKIEPKPIKWFQVLDDIQHGIKHLHHQSQISSTRIYLVEPVPRKGLRVHGTFKQIIEVNLLSDKTIEGKVLEASFTSSLFEDCFFNDIRALKSLIKEVTLGAISFDRTHLFSGG